MQKNQFSMKLREVIKCLKETRDNNTAKTPEDKKAVLSLPL